MAIGLRRGVALRAGVVSHSPRLWCRLSRLQARTHLSAWMCSVLAMSRQGSRNSPMSAGGSACNATPRFIHLQLKILRCFWVRFVE